MPIAIEVSEYYHTVKLHFSDTFWHILVTVCSSVGFYFFFLIHYVHLCKKALKEMHFP